MIVYVARCEYGVYTATSAGATEEEAIRLASEEMHRYISERGVLRVEWETPEMLAEDMGVWAEPVPFGSAVIS